MKKIWLTYAWKDNEDQNIEYVIKTLEEVGLEVAVDRTHIIPGQRIWPQIDKNISSKDIDGWVIFVTENSLRSEPCLEELAYALDRSLRTRGPAFPIIGLFPAPMDPDIIPSAIATRLYVSLNQKNWAQLVANGITQTNPSRLKSNVAPFFIHLYINEKNEEILEVRPRSGRWYPTLIGLQKNSKNRIKSARISPSKAPYPLQAFVHIGNAEDNNYEFKVLYHAADPLNSLYVQFDKILDEQIIFGDQNELFCINDLKIIERSRINSF